MTNEIHEIFGTITDEEKAAASVYMRARIGSMSNQQDGPVRARIFAGCTLVAGAELFAKLDSPKAAAAQLRRLADRLESLDAPQH